MNWAVVAALSFMAGLIVADFFAPLPWTDEDDDE